VVVVHRRTERERIVREQGTWEQAKFQAKRHKSSIALSAVAAGADLTEGVIEGDQSLTVLARSDSLVIFGDGMEADRIQLAWGQTVTITPASRTLRLVV
jgi:hypothetical protein